MGAAADRQLSPLPPHCALQLPVGAPPPPIDRYRPCHRTVLSSHRWGCRRRRSTAYRRHRRAGFSSRRWGRRRRRSTAIALATALCSPAAGGGAAAADRQLSPVPPHWSRQPPVGPPPINSYRPCHRTVLSSRRWGRRRRRSAAYRRRGRAGLLTCLPAYSPLSDQ